MEETILRGIDLKALIAEGLSLYGWNLNGSTLAIMDLRGINFNSVLFRNAIMYQIDLQYANLPAAGPLKPRKNGLCQ